jgi:TorA maturation chaperone TorD
MLSGNNYQDLHAFRNGIYALLARLYQEPIDQKLFARLQGIENPFSEFPIDPSNSEMEKGLKILSTGWKDSASESLTALQTDYNDLFLVPPYGALPYESPWLDQEHLMFQEPTLKVREMYHQFGVQTFQENRFPDDHIGLELEFMAYLSQNYLIQQSHQGEGSSPTSPEWLAAQTRFLEEHLLLWVPDLTRRQIECASTAFYRGLAYLLNGFTLWDYRILSELVSIVQ